MRLAGLDQVNESARKVSPDLYRRFLSRRIIPPNGFPNPQLQAGPLCALAWLNHQSPDMALMSIAAADIGSHFTPTYFIQDDFLRACLATEPPKMLVSEVRFPMPAFTFVLSWEVQRELFDGLWFPFMQVALLEPGTRQLDNPDGEWQCKIPEPEMVVLGVGYRDSADSGIQFFHASRQDKTVEETMHRAGPVLEWQAAAEFKVSRSFMSTVVEAGKEMIEDEDFDAVAARIFKEEGKPGLIKKKDELVSQVNQIEGCIAFAQHNISTLKSIQKGAAVEQQDRQKITGTMNAIAIKVALALSVRPELVEATKILRPEKKKRGEVVRDALWSPIVIGKGYRLIYGDGCGRQIGQSKRMHWRRGHFRNQNFGIGRSNKKLIWIEPCLVNAPSSKPEGVVE